MRGGMHSGGLHPILFVFSHLFVYFLQKDVSSKLKSDVSLHHLDVLTPRL